MAGRVLAMKKNTLVPTAVAFAFSVFLFAGSAVADTKIVTEKPGAKKTADWHKNPECQAVFFTVMEGLYRDGVPQEVVDLVIGHVESNNVDKSFIFRCKLCHACYEAFALYQRRPDFNGTEGRNTVGSKEIPEEVMTGLRSSNPKVFGPAFATIIQPWIKADLEERLANGEEGLELMQRYVELAKEGNALVTTYTRCQACDAIGDLAKAIDEKKPKK